MGIFSQSSEHDCVSVSVGELCALFHLEAISKEKSRNGSTDTPRCTAFDQFVSSLGA